MVASPFAKKKAEELGVNLATVVGTGANGRITAEDVEAASLGGGGVAAAAPAATGYVSATKMFTPEAKKMAKKAGLSLDSLVGTGNFGRVTPDDVNAALGIPKAAPPAPAAPAAAPAPASKAKAAPAAAPAATAGVSPMNSMQKAVVKNMDASLAVPTFQVSRTIVTDELDKLYATLKPKGVTVSALLAKAVALALQNHPLLYSTYVTDGIQYNEHINVAMAVALPDGGLITPTLQDAADKDIYSLGREWKDLIKRAMEKKLTPQEYGSGTFTISNLGMFGVSQFTAILPPGTGSILAVSSSTPTVVPMPNGFLGVVKKMDVTITCDHRQIYGADAAKFLKDLANILENDIQSLLL